MQKNGMLIQTLRFCLPKVIIQLIELYATEFEAIIKFEFTLSKLGYISNFHHLPKHRLLISCYEIGELTFHILCFKTKQILKTFTIEHVLHVVCVTQTTILLYLSQNYKYFWAIIDLETLEYSTEDPKLKLLRNCTTCKCDQNGRIIARFERFSKNIYDEFKLLDSRNLKVARKLHYGHYVLRHTYYIGKARIIWYYSSINTIMLTRDF